MSQTSNNWVTKVILVLASLVLVGVSIAPIIATFTNAQDLQGANKTSTAPNSSQSENQTSKLADEVRGYELVLQREPENRIALEGLLKARLQLLSLKQGDIKGVIEPLEKLAKLNPEETRYAILLGQAKQQMGDREGAALAFRTILQTKPGDLDALRAMVTLLLEQKRPEAAVGLLQDTLKAAPQANKIQPGSINTVAVQVLLGNIHASEKRYSQALEAYDTAIKTDKQDFRPVLAKAMLLKEQGKTEEAKPLFDTAASLAPAQYKDEINQQAIAQPTPSSTPTPSSSPGQ
ncbi:MAG: tetratricopeptide repeat protein [Calothrix sp. SM1_7_51]|nr:tetratricopeptide repeat protein [Calothrix sp. SM1_7_51]